MIILNSPGLLSEAEKNKLKKDSLDLLKKIISSMKLDFKECYITNLIKCDSTDPLASPGNMIENCRVVLESEIREMLPHIIIVMGEIFPVQHLVRADNDIVWFQVEHPVTLIKNPEMKRQVWHTLKNVIEKIEELSL